MTETSTILVVDDDPNNCRILELDLEDAGYQVRIAQDGSQALAILEREPLAIGVVLLDRMMPGLDGLAVTAKLKERPETADIPIVMQTAAATKEQVAEGIQAGVYYYLTKPFEKEVMLAIVSAALRDYAQTADLHTEVQRYQRMLTLTEQSDFRICTRNDAMELAKFLATVFPNPRQAIVGISELLLNAVEHGSTGISYEEKTRLLENMTFEQEVERCLALQENANKKVQVHYKKTPQAIVLDIQDEGQGFEWEQYLELSIERATHTHGRGIALARAISFDEVRYLGCGNRVVCTTNLNG